MIESHNKRVGSRAGQCFCPESYDSGFSGLYGLNHSDSAAHANHYAKLRNIDSSSDVFF